MLSGTDRKLEVSRLIRERYSASSRSDNEPVLESAGQFLKVAMSPKTPTHTLLTEIAKMIHHSFEFQYVSIAMKDPSDEKFRYVVAIGLTPSAEAAYKEIRYSMRDILDESTFPSTKVSAYTHFYMSEDSPFKPGEEKSYSRPTQLSMARSSPDDMIEGDYIDVFMQGYVRDIIGYIELAGTRSGKLPSKTTIRWIELIASLISTIEAHKGGTKA
jgi:hypothetical protein